MSEIPSILVRNMLLRTQVNPGVLLKADTHTLAQRLTLSYRRRRVAWGMPETYREKLSCVASGRSRRDGCY